MLVTNLCSVEPEYIGGECNADVALSLVGVMKEPQLQRNETFLSQVNVLNYLVLLPVPHMQVMTILA